MLLEDTVHAGLDDAPLINGSLGITIRGAGLSRSHGGMYGFWRQFVARYRELGGVLRLGCPVTAVSREQGYVVRFRGGILRAQQVVSALPIELTASLAPGEVSEGLQPYLRRNKAAVGGALVLFLGVPEDEVAGQDFTHHQVLQDYDVRLGNGNNMFISVSSPGDTMSAPAGFRAVMISTHCELKEWEGLSEAEYAAQKQGLTELLLSYARRVYPRLGERAVVCELATPRTFERFTRRPRGAVGGFRQRLSNTNQRAVPHACDLPGFWLVGDTTWPGLGTVACVHGSRIVAEGILARPTKSVLRVRILMEHEHGPDHVARKAPDFR
jgi:phytoene dehydrogenase-like protein